MTRQRAAGPAFLTTSAVLLAAAGPSPAASAGCLLDPVRWSRTTPVDLAVAELAALGAWACLAWLLGGAVLLLAAQVPGSAGRLAGRLARRLLPVVLRGALEAALGVGLAVGPAGGAALPALAQTVPASPPTAGAGPFDRPFDRATAPPVAGERPAASSVDSERPAAPDPATPPAVSSGLPDEPSGRPDVVVVRPGDSLWKIAAAALRDGGPGAAGAALRNGGPGAAGAPAGGLTDAAVDRSWRRWYAANTAVVGADPDLIHPGQHLRPPAPA